MLSGHVDVNWHITDSGVELRWVESGGPEIGTPTRRGFGLRVIGSSIETQLGGRAEFDWRNEGLTCTFFVPFAERRDGTRPPPPPQPAASSTDPRPVPGARVLLLEDETLVALMTAEFLAARGFVVVGPFKSTGDAMMDAKDGEIDAAVLDVNLGGEFVYSVADVLRERGVPFVFVTGYGGESVDPRFADAPILRKPIELDDLREALVALLAQSLAGARRLRVG